MMSFEMHFYVAKTKDGLYHVQNTVMGRFGQHHIHNEKSFQKWKKKISAKYIHISEGSCSCGLTKSGDTREYDGHEWHNDKFEDVEKDFCGECGKELTKENMYSEYTCKQCAKTLGLPK